MARLRLQAVRRQPLTSLAAATRPRDPLRDGAVHLHSARHLTHNIELPLPKDLPAPVTANKDQLGCTCRQLRASLLDQWLVAVGNMV